MDPSEPETAVQSIKGLWEAPSVSIWWAVDPELRGDFLGPLSGELGGGALRAAKDRQATRQKLFGSLGTVETQLALAEHRLRLGGAPVPLA